MTIAFDMPAIDKSSGVSVGSVVVVGVVGSSRMGMFVTAKNAQKMMIKGLTFLTE